MSKTYFVTGTDTEIGKTLITSGLITRAVMDGATAYGLKPIAAGCQQTQSGLINEDAQALMAASNVALDYAQVNPEALAAPLAPHIAAAREGKRLQLDRLEGMVRGALMTRADWRFIEGAGGWRMPLAPGAFLSQLPERLGCPVILVVGVRLGCLNHALLTAEAISRDGLNLAGWVGNCVDPNMDALEDNLATLKYLLPVPCLGVVPFMPEPLPEHAAKHLNLPG